MLLLLPDTTRSIAAAESESWRSSNGTGMRYLWACPTLGSSSTTLAFLAAGLAVVEAAPLLTLLLLLLVEHEKRAAPAGTTKNAWLRCAKQARAISSTNFIFPCLSECCFLCALCSCSSQFERLRTDLSLPRRNSFMGVANMEAFLFQPFRSSFLLDHTDYK